MKQKRNPNATQSIKVVNDHFSSENCYVGGVSAFGECPDQVEQRCERSMAERFVEGICSC